MPNEKASRRGPKKYGPLASAKVARAMHELKLGQFESGRSGKIVTDPKQAIAIGLSEARKQGAKVPGVRSRRPWPSS